MRLIFLFLIPFFVLSCKTESTIDDGFLGGVALSVPHSTISIGKSSLPNGESTTIVVTTRDQYGNVFWKAQEPSNVSLQLIGNPSAGTLSAVTNNNNGTYSSTFTAVTAGHTVTVKATINGVDLAPSNATINVSLNTPGTFAISSSTGGYNNVALIWSNSQNATAYRLQYGVAPGVYNLTASNNATSPYVLTGLTSNTTYYFNITAMNASGNTLVTAPVSVTTASSIMGTPIGALGRLTSSTGSCPSSGPSNGWCMGGVFASGPGDGMLTGVGGMDLDATNQFLYVAEISNLRVSKYNAATGEYIGSIGYAASSTGTCPNGAVATGWCKGGTFATSNADGGFANPRGLTIDSTYLYVAEQNNPRVQRFYLTSGAYAGSIGRVSGVNAGGTCPASAGFSGGWCTGGIFVTGTTDGAMNTTYAGITVDAGRDYLYVADVTRHRIQRFRASTGTFQGAIGRVSGVSSGTCPNSGATNSWCTGGVFQNGAADGMFNSIFSLDIDTTNNILYVAEQSNNRIQKINASNGSSLGAIGRINTSTGSCVASSVSNGWCTGGAFVSGTVDGALSSPRSVAVDVAADTMYVADYNNKRVSKFSLTSGVYVGSIGGTTTSTGTCPSIGPVTTWCTGGTFGEGTDVGYVNYSAGLALDLTRHYLYVSEQGGNRITWYH